MKKKQVDILHLGIETNDLNKKEKKKWHGNHTGLWKGQQQQNTGKVSRNQEIHRGKSAVTNDCKIGKHKNQKVLLTTWSIIGIAVLIGTQWKEGINEDRRQIVEKWGGKDRLDCKLEAILYAA